MSILRLTAAACAMAALGATSRAYDSAEVKRDVVVRAMVDELARSKTLQLNSLEKPYFIAYASDDPEELEITASLGGLTASSLTHVRNTHVRVRVGDANFDNTNFLLTGSPRSVGLPLDNDYTALRTDFWLATDSAYKFAIEQFNRKRTALRELPDADKTPDFAPAKPVQMLGVVPQLKADQKHWEQVIRNLSARFVSHPSIDHSFVRIRVIASTFRLADSDGTIVRVPEELAEIEMRARGLTPDGIQVWNHRFFTGLHMSDLPNEESLTKSVDGLASETDALLKAPVAEEYSGPVLFEQQAAAQMMAQVLTDALRIERRPIIPKEFASRAPKMMDSVWGSRVGSKVTPEWLTIYDDPAQTNYQGVPLAGRFDVDEEGVPAARVNLVEKGTLKTVLTTRQPVRNLNASTGHARLNGAYGAELPVFGNLFVAADKTDPEAQLKTKLLALVKDRNLKYGMIIRRLDFPSTATTEELQNIANQLQKSGVNRTVTVPLAAFRVYPDGREELVRGARFKDISAKDLRDLEAASDHPYVLNYVNNGSSYDYVDSPVGATTSSLICPSLLFNSLDLDGSSGERGKQPVVPPPALVAMQ